MKRDYYEILGIAKNASKEDIKKAYRKLAMQHHPDRNPNNKEAESKFKEASEAAEILLEDNKRARYDQMGHAGFDGTGGASGFGGGGFQSGDFGDLGDIFGDIFGDILGGSRGRGGRARGGRSRATVGDDLQINLTLSFTEAAFGIEKEVSVMRNIECDTCHGSGARKGSGPTTCDFCQGQGEIRRQQGFFMMSQTCPKCQGTGQMIKDPCDTCHGSGKKKKKSNLMVKVPPGIDQGQRLKLSGEGGAGTHGGPAGDLYVLIDIETHELFEREGFDVLCTVPISFSQAALGAEIEVPTLSGRVALNIQAGTQSGKKMRLKNKGIAKLGGYGLGDQIITIQIETPTKLSKEQKEHFERLLELEQNSASNPMAKGFFDRVKNIFQ